MSWLWNTTWGVSDVNYRRRHEGIISSSFAYKSICWWNRFTVAPECGLRSPAPGGHRVMTSYDRVSTVAMDTSWRRQPVWQQRLLTV